MIEEPTVFCETCGKDTILLSTKRCNNCWEVESRLDTFLRSPKAVELVRLKLVKLRVRSYLERALELSREGESSE